MVSRPILCVDIGTSSLKAAFIDVDGRCAAYARAVDDRLERNPVLTASIGAISGAVSADSWEYALARVLGELFSQAGDCKPQGICISGAGPTLVPVLRDGAALTPLHWYRNLGIRSNADVQKDGEASRSFFLPHALRFLRECPREYEQTQYLFSAQEWLSWRLGADPVTVLPESYGSYYWDDDQCRVLGLDRGKFPPFVKLGAIIGRLSPGAIRRLGDLAGGLPEGGLLPGIPIIAGGSDFIMALIGTGTVSPGMACDRAGTSEGINFCSASPADTGELRVLPHVSPGLWNISIIIPSSGRLFEWYRNLTGQEVRAYEDTLAELIPDGGAEGGGAFSQGTSVPWAEVPGTQMPLFFPEEALVLAGRSGLFSRIELGRAVLEAMGFQVKAGLDTLARHGFPARELRLSGGQCRNRRWNQLKADITGIALLALEQLDGELGGAAVLGAVALGEAAGLGEAVGRIVRIQERYEPDPAAVAVYGERFEQYRYLREKAEAAFNEML
jgi:xylulokinase